MSRQPRGSGPPTAWGSDSLFGTFKTNADGGAYTQIKSEQVPLQTMSAQRPAQTQPPMPSAPPMSAWNQPANQSNSYQQQQQQQPAPTGISPQVSHTLTAHRDIFLAMLLPLAIAFSMPMIYWFTISKTFSAEEHGMFIATLVDTGMLFCAGLLSIPVLSRTNKATFDGAMWWLWLYTIVVVLLFILDIVLIGITNIYGGDLKPGLYFGCGITIISGLILSIQSGDALHKAHSVPNKTSGKHHSIDSSMVKDTFKELAPLAEDLVLV